MYSSNTDIVFRRLNPNDTLKSFDCANPDLNDFFINDAQNYAKELLAVTYVIESSNDTIAFFCVSNDLICTDDSDNATWRKIRKEIPHSKHRGDYPAVKIGRLGVSNKYKQQGYGRMIIDYVKTTFIDNNRTGCRFITVDAYGEAIPFYIKNGFKFLLKEDQLKKKDSTDTYLMYFDLSSLL
ncbi:MAG: GNAT family N-acetyltransferase [Bacteroidales bacterium]|jgi:GNAT superfamily N-acetyltransferase